MARFRQNARRQYSCLRDLATARWRALAFIPACAASGLARSFRILAATLATCPRAGCALTCFRLVRHWNLLSVCVDVASTTGGSHPKRQPGLYELAIFGGRTGYLAGEPRRGVEALSLALQKGEMISANLPRINTDGAMPTI